MATKHLELEFFFQLCWLDVFTGMDLCEDETDYDTVVVFEGLEVLGGGELEWFLFQFVLF